MPTTSDSDSDDSNRSASPEEDREEESDPEMDTFCKNLEKMLGGGTITLGPGEINLRLMAQNPNETNAARRLLQFS